MDNINSSHAIGQRVKPRNRRIANYKSGLNEKPLELLWRKSPQGFWNANPASVYGFLD